MKWIHFIWRITWRPLPSLIKLFYSNSRNNPLARPQAFSILRVALYTLMYTALYFTFVHEAIDSHLQNFNSSSSNFVMDVLLYIIGYAPQQPLSWRRGFIRMSTSLVVQRALLSFIFPLYTHVALGLLSFVLEEYLHWTLVASYVLYLVKFRVLLFTTQFVIILLVGLKWKCWKAECTVCDNEVWFSTRQPAVSCTNGHVLEVDWTEYDKKYGKPSESTEKKEQ